MKNLMDDYKDIPCQRKIYLVNDIEIICYFRRRTDDFYPFLTLKT